MGLITVTGDTRLDFQLVRSSHPPSGRSLAGVVFERVGSVAVPIAGAVVEDSYTHLSALTAPDGRYRIEFNPADLGRFDGFADIFVRKDGFETANRSVVITGDSRLDLELIRR
jgi:hypothetical protein